MLSVLLSPKKQITMVRLKSELDKHSALLKFILITTRADDKQGIFQCWSGI